MNEATTYRKISRRALRELQVYWYRKIRELDPDWNDVERWVDLGNYAGRSTLDLSLHVPLNQETADGADTQLGDTDRYLYWSRIRHAAYALPRDDAHRAFLVECSEAGVIVSPARMAAHGLTQRKARTIWERFLKQTAWKR